ncbi:hypothetical protein OGH69_04390 [Flavobacterium sp. MFBS3-15]|uniref:hypothetical protein n=1 Tax=Flavobacterium sp. MFBS3-15 TaxID=2989816 RepID=UPI0022361D0F|nr:hypothetical protein [Flavobacterium sp. MFBS3-15]MCW4468196.1 hypothetical protein [Flavobacterium sp. MFBS3-15]
MSTATDNTASAHRIYQADVNDYISNFYGTTFVFTDSIETSDKDRDYIIRAVTVGTDTEARGYLVSDAADNEPVGFIDIDHANHVMKMVDMATEEMDVIEDLDEDPVFTEIKGNLITLVELGNAPEAQSRGWYVIVEVIVEIGDNFWGDIPGCGSTQVETDPLTLEQHCYKNCTIKKKRFWITWSSTDYQQVVDCP